MSIKQELLKVLVQKKILNFTEQKLFNPKPLIVKAIKDIGITSRLMLAHLLLMNIIGAKRSGSRSN